MARRFTAANIVNGYAAMGGALRRPIYKNATSGRTIAQAIQEERARAARIARASKKK